MKRSPRRRTGAELFAKDSGRTPGMSRIVPDSIPHALPKSPDLRDA